MTCNSCVTRVKSELLKLGDIESAEVQLATPQATITMQRHIPVEKLQEAVSKAGTYKIAEVNGMQHHAPTSAVAQTAESNSYFPIVLIFAFITGITLFIQWIQGVFMWMQWMRHFMAGFFFVFSFFKFMNLRGFQEGYGTYDIVARRWPTWGWIYPFVELALAFAFLSGFEPLITNIVTLLVMGVSSIGVIQSLRRKSTFQCACLGTVIKLPLSKVTLAEDLLMVLMSAAMIIALIA